jgi:hypothetical protein
MNVALDEIKNHVEEEGEKTFNLFTYIERLELRLDTILNGNESPVGKFKLDTNTVALYLWYCIATNEGGDASPNTFRGMSVLD